LKDKVMDGFENREAEVCVLGGVLLVPERIAEVMVRGVRREVFVEPRNGVMWDAIVEVWRERGVVDVVLLVGYLRERKMLESVSVAYVSEVSGSVDTVVRLMQWVEDVMVCWRRRVIAGAGKKLELAVREDPVRADALLAEHLDGLRQLWMGEQEESLGDVVAREEQALEDLFNGVECTDVAVRTGLLDFDRRLKPFRVSYEDYLVILMARPSCGKSSLARNIVSQALKDGLRCVGFLEETVRRNYVRLMAATEARFNLHYISEPPVEDAGKLFEWERGRDQLFLELKRIREEWADKRLFLYDQDFRIDQIESRCRMLAARYGRLDLVVVDYLQLVETDKQAWSREQQVADVSRRLKRLAKELNCTVLALAQMNREGDEYSEPKLSDLRESGQIEQDADRVIGIQMMKTDFDGKPQQKGQGRLFVRLHQLKFRNGVIGYRGFWFDKRYTVFTDMGNVDAESPRYKKREEYGGKKKGEGRGKKDEGEMAYDEEVEGEMF
jgi:replicative DNA helicase